MRRGEAPVVCGHLDVGQSVGVPEPVDLGPTGGVVWSHPAEWERRRRPDGCIICTSGGPLDIIAELPTCWATAPPVAPLPGYVCVVARQHIIEPFDLSPEQQSEFWRDSMVIAEAVASAMSPIKMNYEIHGNTLPHLHLHLFPRQLNDPFVGGPIDPRRSSISRTNAELHALGSAIQSALGG
jgi:diadenosine tetraphosphate (Ap4A) HIT family hydrolase